MQVTPQTDDPTQESAPRVLCMICKTPTTTEGAERGTRCPRCDVQSCEDCGRPISATGRYMRCRKCRRRRADNEPDPPLCAVCERPCRTRVAEGKVPAHTRCLLLNASEETRPVPTHREIFNAFKEPPPVPGATLEMFERYVIMRTLEHVDWSTSRAAKMLGVSARLIQYRLDDYRAQVMAASTAATPPTGGQ